MKKIIGLIFSVLIIFSACQSQDESVNPQKKLTAHSLGLAGSSADVVTESSLGIVLMGGSTDVENALRWMIKKSGGGDFVIIRASGSTGYNDYIYNLGGVNSVETFLLDSREKANDPAVGKRLREAEALFIAGGDQGNYVKFWIDTEVSSAIKYLVEEKKIPIGGTSAGCAVLSEYIFDAREGSAVSEEVLLNPYHNTVSLSKSFIELPYLKNVIADQHYSQREREGRHVVFLARMLKDFALTNAKGIGVDEKTAVCIDEEGEAVVYGLGNAYFIQSRGLLPEKCENAQALQWNHNQEALSVKIVAGTTTGNPVFNLLTWPDTADQYWFVEDGVLKRKNN
jgi:cyanophycinase